MTNVTKALLGGVAVAVLAGGVGYFAARHAAPTHTAPARPASVSHPASPTSAAKPAPAAKTAENAPAPAAPTATASNVPMVGPCKAPAHTPPQTPDGATATDAQMKAAHDALQAYVNELEAFQACLNHAADDTSTDIPPELRNTWIERGNGAIDEATLLAQAFASAKAAHDAAHPAGK